MTILETKRLTLRRFTLADLDELYDLVYADGTVKSTWSGRTGTPDEIKAGFAREHIEPVGDFGFRAIVRKSGSQLLGLMGYQQHLPDEDISYLLSKESPNRTISSNPDFIEVELTYALGQAYWKQGYATEMGLALVRYGFEQMKIKRIIQGVLGDNHHSINLMRRLGFRIEKQLKADGVVGVLDDFEKWKETIQPDVNHGTTQPIF